MRIIASLFCLCLLSLQGAAQTAAADGGYEIQCTIKPYKNQWAYLAYYYGKIKALADSVYLNSESKGVMKGIKPLAQGIYIVASPSKTILVEMIIGKDQQFSFSTDTTNLDATLQFTGSDENLQFQQYTHYMTPRAIKANELSGKMETADSLTKVAYQAELRKLNQEIYDYRAKVVKETPEGMLASLFKCMKELEYPANMRNPKTKADSNAMYRYGKDHYWDEVDFMDGRLARTPVFEPKLTNYLQAWVSPEPDSIIYEFNWMAALARNDEEMFRFIIGYYVDNYMYPKIMGQDKVFLHVYNNYIAGDNPKVTWLNERQLKVIRERAYMLMANQLGAQAWDMRMADTTGAIKSLYDVKADYTVVSFWDVHCGKCKEEIPRMDTIYQTKWKQHSIKVYSVMVNESALADWKPFIRKFGKGWTHVHQTEALRKEEEQGGKPGFRQLYDMRSTPSLFLLDKDKKIIAKNISLNDLDKVLEQKLTPPNK